MMGHSVLYLHYYVCMFVYRPCSNNDGNTVFNEGWPKCLTKIYTHNVYGGHLHYHHTYTIHYTILGFVTFVFVLIYANETIHTICCVLFSSPEYLWFNTHTIHRQQLHLSGIWNENIIVSNA